MSAWLLAGAVLAGCAEPLFAEGETGKLHYLFATLYDRLLEEFPEQATLLGNPAWDDRWSSHSPQALVRRKQLFESYLADLRSIPREALPAADRLNHQLCERALLRWIADLSFEPYYATVNHVDGLHHQVFATIAAMDVRRPDAHEDILARLHGLPRLVGETLLLLEEGLEHGWVQPRRVVDLTLAQLERQMPENPWDSPLLDAFRELPDTTPEEEREHLRQRAEQAYRTGFLPAWRRLRDYLAGPYERTARETVGMDGLPDGRALYATEIARATSSPLSAEQIHELGLEEVRRIGIERRKLRVRLGFRGTPKAFFEQVLESPRFRFDEEEAILAAARNIGKRAEPELPKLFARLPRMPWGVRPMPESRLEAGIPALYQPPAPDGSQAGYLYLATRGPRALRKHQLEPLMLHEAVPGHHLQVALQMEHQEIPGFRAFYPVTEFAEGWALYAESLGPQIGFYRDAYSRYARLSSDMVRACRLVLDTGIHALGWSREQALAYLEEHAGDAPEEEVDRYVANPARSLAYKMGEQKLLELRRLAASSLGRKFDAREFHDLVLGYGMIPLDLLEREVRAWIETRTEPAPVSP